MLDLLPQTLIQFSSMDIVAVSTMVLLWLFMGWLIERESTGNRSTHSLIREYRFKWMEEATHRDNQIFDASILDIQHKSASFFTSATMIAIGGGVALLGRAEDLQVVAADISAQLEAPRSVWEIKILVVVLLLASAFLKFVWATRLFGYCAVVMAAIPHSGEDLEESLRVAKKAAVLNVSAARSFNRGLRNMYFALTALVWVLGAYALIVATIATCLMLYRREFHAKSRAFLLDN